MTQEKENKKADEKNKQQEAEEKNVSYKTTNALSWHFKFH